MKRRLYAPTVLLIGLLSAEIVATAHLYVSNLTLYQTIDAVRRSGYLAVPNETVAAGLTSLKTALTGGLFFTLSIGAGLSLAAMMLTWMWDRLFKRRRRALPMVLAPWITALVAVNFDGLNLVATLYVLVVPTVTATTAIVLLPTVTTMFSPRSVLWPIAAIAILALAWSLVADADLFTNVRDHLLLKKPIGRWVTNAYYNHTLYPAEAFKSLSQKQMRTCVLDPYLDRIDRVRIERIVRIRDYLPVPNGVTADLTVAPGADPTTLVLKHGNAPIMTVATRSFFKAPDDTLARFSAHLDTHRMFRKMTLGGLLVGLPLLLFTFLFNALGLVSDMAVSMAVSNAIAAALCIAVGISLLIPVYRGHQAMTLPPLPIQSLGSASDHRRIATLRKVAEERQDITLAAINLDLANSPSVAERYWLARALAGARRSEAKRLLRQLADDPVPIVRCQALWAMGKRGNHSMRPWIIKQIDTSPHWYFQMYAYRTLRKLGWVQPKADLYSR